ncbi:MAG: cation-transporting P-type ATPase, partial [Acidimicrobiales bacterium]|nr:cation-transporting P-type ATPase [Acidimicrobiales bacterium]
MAASEPTASAPEVSPETRWYAQEATSVVQQMGGDADHGLAQTEAVARLARFGPNEITGVKPP